LTKKIHIKQPIFRCVIAELTNFMMILGQNGKVLILDACGQFVSCISRVGVMFKSITTANDKLLLGTDTGTVHAYHLASL
jgi:hypothetical protein